MKIRIGVLGATGYTALELLELLLRHPHAEIVLLSSRQTDHPPIASVHPRLTGRLNLSLETPTVEEIAARCDCVFSCLPHAASASSVKPLVDAGVRVVDFSADYRLHQAETYSAWYGNEHPDPDRLGGTPYGMPELYKEAIGDAKLVANPGCYPTSAILPLTPLLREQLIVAEGLVIDAKSGVSGAGRTPKLMTHYPECNESICAYGVGQHRHTPEIDQFLGLACGQDVQAIFTPHLTPMNRGILSTIYAQPVQTDETKLVECLRDFYRDAPFVRVVENPPSTRDVRGTNFCDIAVKVSRGRAILVCCIDNLIKGASGAAVQNFNVMYGFEETSALL